MPTIYKVLLEQKSGLLSELQSDTIFGHICWRLKENLGEDTLKEFLSFFKDGKPVFTISDGCIEKEGITYFRKPKMQTPFQYENKTKKEIIKDAIIYKELKSREYVTLEQMNYYLNNEIDEFNKSFETVIEAPRMYSEVRVNVQIDRKTSGSAEGKLFTVNPSYSEKNSFIVVFIKELDKDAFKTFKVLDIIHSVFETGYGKKKTSGFGEFDIDSITEFNNFKEPDNSNGFISLSNYLPSNKDNISNAYYDLNVKYGKLGEEYGKSQNPFKKPLLLLTAGSCFLTDKKSEFYGRCTDESEISDYFPNTIQNGIAFSLNFNLT